MCNESMVYLNKVFSNLRAESCPLMTDIVAGGSGFSQQLTFSDPCGNGCGCGCNDTFEVDEDTNFTIESTEIIVSDFDLLNAENLRAGNVTVNGMAVDGLDYFNERYMASTNDLMTRISDCACMENGLATRGYFLITGAGPWRAKMTIVVTGSAFGCGGCRQFRLCMTTENGVYFNIPGTSTFAASDICLPCTTGGIAPIINFSFGATGTLLNPTLRADSGSQCGLILSGALILVPDVEIQVTRQSLFRTTAESLNIPCDDIEKCNECSGSCQCASATAETAEPERSCICCQFNGYNGCAF